MTPIQIKAIEKAVSEVIYSLSPEQIRDLVMTSHRDLREGRHEQAE